MLAGGAAAGWPPASGVPTGSLQAANSAHLSHPSEKRAFHLPLLWRPHAWCRAGFLRRLGFHSRQLWRRVVAEFWAEWPLLKPRFWVIVLCLIFQYVHAIFTGMACEWWGAAAVSGGCSCCCDLGAAGVLP